MGAWQWLQQVTGAPAYWNSLTAAEAAYLRAVPLWTDIAFGLAVWGGLCGALLLLARRREATAAFAIALAGMVADTVYIHLMSNGREVMGTVGTVFGVVLILILVAQTAYCAGCAAGA